MEIRFDNMLVSSSGPHGHSRHAVINNGLNELTYRPDRPAPPGGPLDPEPPWSPTGTRFRPVLRPTHARPTVGPIGARTTTSSPLDKATTWSPMGARPPWSPLDNHRPAMRPPDYYLPDDWPRWQPPAIKLPQPEPPPRVPLAAYSEHTTLEKLLWVALGGFAVLLLIAICMKIGAPSRRERRQVTRVPPARRSPRAAHNGRNLHRDHDGDSELGAMTRSPDAPAASQPGALSDDPPPPYSECVRTACKPPPYRAPSVSYTDIKHVEPLVHTHRPVVCELPAYSVRNLPL